MSAGIGSLFYLWRLPMKAMLLPWILKKQKKVLFKLLNGIKYEKR
jgi:hypothetical protein